MPPPVNEAPRYVTVRDYVRVARERRLLIVAMVVLFTAAAYVYADRQEPRYEAEATLEFQSQNTQTSLFGQTVDVGGQTPETRAAAAAATLVRPAVLDRAAEALDLKGSSDVLSRQVTARPEARTNLVIVTGSGPDADAAAKIANAIARATVSVAQDEARREYASAANAQRNVLKQLRKQPGSGFTRALTLQSIARLDELSQVARPAVVRREATVPRGPSSPNVVRTTLLGLLVGLTLGLVAAFFRDSLDGRFRTSRDLTADLDLPVLGHVPESILGAGLVEHKGGFLRRRGSALSQTDLEPFRILRRNIEFLNGDGDTATLVLVTSATPDEGKSTTATALAVACAMAGKRTLIVEGDLRRPTVAERLGIRSGPGLSDYLTGRATPEEVLQTIAVPEAADGARAADAPDPGPIVAIVAGAPVSQPAELLRSERCRAFFEEVKQAYDVVIVDSCPLLSVVDTLELAPLADTVVLCVRGSRTTRAQVEAAKETLSHLPERSMGVVVTGLRVGDEESHYGYYAYGRTAGSAPR